MRDEVPWWKPAVRIVEDWSGHRVLALPDTTFTLLGLVRLRDELGFARGRRTCCALCPAWDTTEHEWRRCTNPRWYLPLARGGCGGYFVIAEEYIPLVQIRLGEQL